MVLDINDSTLPGGMTQTEGDSSTTLTVTAGQTAHDTDGFKPSDTSGTLTGTVYEDTNGNGQQDANETGIAGTKVTITDGSGHTQTVVTDEDGSYTVTVPEGNATILIDESTLPDGVVQTEGENPTTVTVPANGTATDTDGFKPGDPDTVSTVTGTIYKDTNDNGIQDPGEPGIPGVAVTVTDSNGHIQTVMTDENGQYRVTVAPGDVLVDIEQSDLPDDLIHTENSEGDDPTRLTVAAGKTIHSKDGFAPKPKGTVVGVVYRDTDGDGIQGPGEPGIPGVTVTITDAEGTTHTLTTDADGKYSMVVPTGNAVVKIDAETLPDGMTPTQIHTPTVTVEKDKTTSIADGFEPPANTGGGSSNKTTRIEAYLYYDDNHNGKWDKGEHVATDATVELLDKDGNPMSCTQANGVSEEESPEGRCIVKTDKNGHFAFHNLPPDHYKIRFTLSDKDIKNGYTLHGGGTSTVVEAETLTNPDAVVTLDAGAVCACENVAGDSVTAFGIFSLFWMLLAGLGLGRFYARRMEQDG